MSDDLERDPGDPAQLVGLQWQGFELDDGAGPSLRRDPVVLDELVTSALQRVAVVRPPWWRSRRSAPLVGVGIIAISTAAAAAAGLAPRLLAAWGEQQAAAPVVAVAASPSGQSGTASGREVVAPVVSDVADVPAASEQANVEGNTVAQQRNRSALQPASLGAVAHPALRAAVAGITAAKTVRATPEDLLARASQLRKAKAYKEALAIYEQVLSRYPGTRQAALARVAAAQIELSNLGAVQSAQRRFKEAQADQEVGPEALFGLAEACRAQSDAAGERSALQRLVNRHADSPLSAAAQQRLRALSVP